MKFRYYEVDAKINSDDESSKNLIRVKGVVSETPDLIGKIFRQHTELLKCNHISRFETYPCPTFSR